MQSEKYNGTFDLGFDLFPLDEIIDHINVAISDIFLLEILTTLIEVKNNVAFEFVYLFDVWVNQIDFKS